MTETNGGDLLPKLYDVYESFLKSKNARHLVVLGRPRTGKRWILEQVLADYGIEPFWQSSGVIPSDYAGEVLKKGAGKLTVLYELSHPFLTEREGLETFLSFFPARDWMKEGDDKTSDSPVGLESKCILLDDPYGEGLDEANPKIDGVMYTFTVQDLVDYVSGVVSSLASYNEVSEESLQKVLSVYKTAVDKSVISASDEFEGVQFSVAGLARAAKLLDQGDNAWVMFPQELMKFAKLSM